MACQNVSGVAALLWSKKPTTTATEIRDAMLNTAEDLGSSGYDTSYGNGLVRVKAASDFLIHASQSPSASPRPSASPSASQRPSASPSASPSTTPCLSHEISVQITLKTDDWVNETDVILTRESNGTAEFLFAEFPLMNDKAYRLESCLPYKDCYTVTITDSAKDGICCAFGKGSFEVYFEG
jgi:hypothetical protein